MRIGSLPIPSTKTMKNKREEQFLKDLFAGKLDLNKQAKPDEHFEREIIKEMIKKPNKEDWESELDQIMKEFGYEDAIYPVKQFIKAKLREQLQKERKSIQPTAVYTAQQAYPILGICKTTMARLVKEGKIKPIKLGKSYRFLGEYLIKLLKIE